MYTLKTTDPTCSHLPCYSLTNIKIVSNPSDVSKSYDFFSIKISLFNRKYEKCSSRVRRTVCDHTMIKSKSLLHWIWSISVFPSRARLLYIFNIDIVWLASPRGFFTSQVGHHFIQETLEKKLYNAKNCKSEYTNTTGKRRKTVPKNEEKSF